ncbi:hypothetical protein DEI81_00110 [Curtobacterium sp. MCBD17_013]|uniref:hypothetical protein n=1 Tax=Curtobacterium sp. MCBD17_013 TaxID=2175668 RepID=UPI000DA95211|nr:hypothetical protein [Curtobacterium sp. MCBD17_013]PZF66086.1 hypothetical protein DEI81_00110 [Curtobacterium sp. MCBD17_013]
MIVAPALAPAQAAAWHALFDAYERLPRDWILVGGQMVQSLCWERGSASARPTQDADVALDVRARPQILWDLTRVLADLGFEPDGTSFEGHQHRWVREGAQIDVLQARFLGERADSRRGVRGGTTIAAPGTQGALYRASEIEVDVNGRVGRLLRPTLQGALVSKAAAADALVGQDNSRHLVDIATLAALVERRDALGIDLTATERRRLLAAVARIKRDPSLSRRAGVDPDAVEVIRIALASD